MILQASSHTFIAHRRIRADGRLLGIRCFVLGQDGAGNVQAGDHVVLGQLEAEALGVVVDDLDVLKLQRDEALVAAGQGLLGADSGDGILRSAGRLLDLGLGLLGGAGTREVVGTSTDGGGSDGVQQSVRRLLRGWLGRRRWGGGGLRCVFAQLLGPLLAASFRVNIQSLYRQSSMNRLAMARCAMAG